MARAQQNDGNVERLIAEGNALSERADHLAGEGEGEAALTSG